MRTFGRSTVVVHVLLSLLVFGSPSEVVDTCAVLTSDTGADISTCAEREMVPLAPAAWVPRFQISVWPETLDGAGLADTYDRPAGSVSRTTTLAAGAVPMLRQVIWYVMVSLTSAVAGPVFTTLTSGRWIVVVTVEELLPGVLSVYPLGTAIVPVFDTLAGALVATV